MSLKNVLIVDDEPKIRAVVRQALEGEAERVSEAATGRAAIAMVEAERPELVILDLGLPDMDGFDVCRAIRTWSSVPILVLSARTGEEEKARILDAGADDYVTKPFSTIELRARMRAQARRAQMPSTPGTDKPIVVGDLVINTAYRSVTQAGEAVHLTRTEWALLRTLIAHAGQPVTHEQLFASVWKQSQGDAQLYLRVYIAHLRRKLEANPYRPTLILTEPGVGYRFVLEP